MYLPGLAATGALACVARIVHQALPGAANALVGEVLLGIGLGLLCGNLFRLPRTWDPGIQFAVKGLLKLSIVLLGARLALGQVFSMGAHALVIIVVLMTLAMGVAHAVGSALKIPTRLATLIAVGAAICGNTAIAALAPLIKAKDEEVSFAIAINTLIGTLAMFSFPIVGHALGFSDSVFGTWAGTAVNDTAQVLATGFAYSDQAGEIATVIKLTRNACMVFVIVGVGMAYAQLDHGPVEGSVSLRERVSKSFPTFLLGFLLMACINTLGGFDWASELVGLDLSGAMAWLCKAFILVALTAVGMNTNFHRLARTGIAPAWVGLATALTTATMSLVLVYLLGPVAFSR